MKQVTLLIEETSTYNSMIDIMFGDLLSEKKIIKILENKSNAKIENILKKNKIEKKFGKITGQILYKKFRLYEFLRDNAHKYDRINILFLNSSFIQTRYPLYSLKKYKKKFKNLRYILFYIDIINHPVCQYANYLRRKGIFDSIYTVDEDDAKKYNLKLWKTPYSKYEKFVNKVVKKDIYFCGVLKERDKKIKKILDGCKKNKIIADLDIVCNEKETEPLLTYKEFINFHMPDDYLNYLEVLKNSLEANCILEIVQDGQKALTLRPYEAVAYNKKLLTNNKTILDFEFYDSRYMKYYEKESDIDWEWVKRKEKVHYSYNNEFSPIHLLRNIEK